MRGITFTDVHTGNTWGLVLTKKSIPRAEVKENFIVVEGRNGNLDYTEAFGDIKYNNRSLTFSFSLSTGTYLQRETLINTIVQKLHGKRHTIITDDDLTHYFSGRCKVENINNNVAYATLDVTVNADPWYYSVTPASFSKTVSGSTTLTITNTGRMICTPTIVVTGTITIAFDGNTHVLSAGTYVLADLKLATESKILTLSGSGTITLTFREAIL